MFYNLYHRAKNLCQKTDKNTHTENGNVKVTPAKGKQTYQNNQKYVRCHVNTRLFF